jgi:glycyl-tRNA synthetase alpha subunit
MNYEIEYYKLKEIKTMQNGIGKLSLENIYSALVYGVVAVALYIIAQGTVFGLDWRMLVDIGALGILSSFVKNLMTTDKGNFVGVVKVIPPIE